MSGLAIFIGGMVCGAVLVVGVCLLFVDSDD